MNYSLLRRLSAGAVCAALLATMTACGGGSSAPAADSADSSADGGTVKVGLLHSLTGSMAISETSVRDAEVLAIDEINKAGGVNGCQIEYVEEDGASLHRCYQGRKADRQRWRSNDLRLLDLLLAQGGKADR